MTIRQWIARLIGGTSVIVLAEDEAAVVFGEHDRSARGLYLVNSDSDDLGPGSALASAVFVAAHQEPGRLVAALDSLDSVQGIIEGGQK